MDPEVDPDRHLIPVFFAITTALVCVIAWTVPQLLLA
jgi:hypothetical protein